MLWKALEDLTLKGVELRREVTALQETASEMHQTKERC
jgi:hypothetical protein